MKIVDNRALMFVTKHHEQITSLIPKSKVLETYGDKARVLVNWGLDEWRLLKNLGIKSPPHPITGKYAWPGVYVPFDHQRTTAEFLVSNSRCYVLNEAGTGKTSAAAWAADYLLTHRKIRRVLIVCPLSIMDTAWRADLFRTVMHRSVGIATGTRKQRLDVITSGCEFVIINFDGVKVATDALASGGFDLIIIDEVTAIKSVATDRWKAMSALVKPGDVMVCHNVSYDLERCLQNSCRLLDIDCSAILSLPLFCTCRSEWAMTRNNDKWLSLAGLCAMFGVKNAREHTSGDDALALAQCMSKALTAKPGQDLGLAEILRLQLASA